MKWRFKERTACKKCYYRNKRLQNKVVGTCQEDGKSRNPKNPFTYNPAGERDPGRPQKRRNDQFLIQSESNSNILQ